MKQFNTNQIRLIETSTHVSKNMSTKLLKLKYLLQNSKSKKIPSQIQKVGEVESNYEKSLNFIDNQLFSKLGQSATKTKHSTQKFQHFGPGFQMSKDLSLYLSLIEKPLNLLFSIDQFLFEFSKKTYQQKKTGEFFQQLKERKKLSLFYGHLTRKQIVNIFNKVKRNKGYFAKNLFSLLERRLDVVLYRSGLAKTITEARQLIKHKKILINQQIMNVPGYSLNPGDFISIASKTTDSVGSRLEGFSQISTNLGSHINKKNWNSTSKNEFYSKLTKILNLSDQKLKSFLNKSKKLAFDSHLKQSDFFDKNLTSTRSFKAGVRSTSRVTFHSKLLCNLMIQLLCTKIKARCYWNLRKNGFCSNNDYTFSNFSKKSFLTLLKWKSFFHKKRGGFQNFDKFGNSTEKSLKKTFRQKTDTQNTLYANQGCLQKKPLFWSVINFKKSNKFSDSKKFQLQHSQSVPKLKNFGRQFNPLKKKNSRFYRTSFFVFLKYLENSPKFTGLVTLSMKKFLFKKSKHNLKFTKVLNFRRIRPLHIEVSYNLLNLVYLFSPQRINFPFYIDLDLINRSLR